MARTNREVRLHCAILDYLRLVLPSAAVETLIHVPNGENRAAKTGALLKRLGTKPGVEDLQFVWHGRLHAIEVKCEGSYQSPAQKDRAAAVIAAGGRYTVCRSIDDVTETLTEWAIPTRNRSCRSFRPSEART